MTLVFFGAVLFFIYGAFRPFRGAPRWKRGHYAAMAVILTVIWFVMLISAGSESGGGDAEVEGWTQYDECMANAKGNEAVDACKAAAGYGAPDSGIKAAASTEPRARWQYHTQTDEMRGTESRFAQLTGSNTIDLDFPSGEQRGRMVVRQSPQFGFDILVGVESGHIMCNSYSRSYINVKFDDAPIQRYGCNGASDGSSNMVFVQNAKGFLGKLKKSERVIVEAEFYQNGLQQLKFDTAGLEWKD